MMMMKRMITEHVVITVTKIMIMITIVTLWPPGGLCTQQSTAEGSIVP